MAAPAAAVWWQWRTLCLLAVAAALWLRGAFKVSGPSSHTAGVLARLLSTTTKSR